MKLNFVVVLVIAGALTSRSEYFIAMRKLQEEARLDQQRIAAECEARLLAPLTEQQQQKFRELFGQPLTKSDQAAGL